MRDGATKSFVQAHNAQAAVVSHPQVIVATGVAQAATDVQRWCRCSSSSALAGA